MCYFLIMINRVARQLLRGSSLLPSTPHFHFSYKIYKQTYMSVPVIQDKWSWISWTMRMTLGLYIGYAIYKSTQDDSVATPKIAKKEVNGLTSSFGARFPKTSAVSKKTRLSDIQGIDEFKDEFQEIIDYLKEPAKYTDSGATLPKGILLVGSPGTGKTMMARALAT